MNIQPYKVLIVEDDNNVAAALKNELQSQGYTVDCAVSVHEGLARAKHEDFDVVLTDLWLPDPGDLKSPGGLKTVCQLRAIKPHLPVIVMSGSATGDGEIESIKLGAYGYIRKPCKLQELLDVLGKAVTARRVVSKAAEPGEAVTAEDTLVQRRDKDCNRSTVPAPVRGEPGSANKKVARALTASRVMKAGGRMEPVRQLLLRIVQRFHNRLVRSSSIIEGQKELGRYRMLMSGLRHDATNFLAHIVAGLEILRRLQGKQSEGTVGQRFDRVAKNLRSTCEGLQKMTGDFTVDLRPSSTNRPQRTPISARESPGPTGPAPTTAGPLFEEARDLFRYLWCRDRV